MTEMMQVKCTFPECPGSKTVDPRNAVHDEPIHWLCEVHREWIGMTCQHDGCGVIAFYPKTSAPTFYHCPDHDGEPVVVQGRPEATVRFNSPDSDTDCHFCNDPITVSQKMSDTFRTEDGKKFHVDCLIRMLKDNIHDLENPRSLENLTLDEAKAVAQAAGKRLADCTFEEAANDVWAAAVNKIIQDEHVAFLTWLAQVKNLFICRLHKDEMKLLVAEETRNDLIGEFTVYRKKT